MDISGALSALHKLETPAHVTRDMWETLLDALERRLPRREGVTDEDVKQVRAALAAWKPPPAAGTSDQ